LQENYAYVGMESAVIVVDISDLAQPRAISCVRLPNTLEWGERVASLFAAEDYLYVGTGGSRLVVIDVSDPLAPFPTGSYTDLDTFFSTKVQGHYAYVIHGYRWYGSLMVIDVSDPARPVKVAELPGLANGLALQGGYVYLADRYNRDVHREYEITGGLRVVDIRDPTNLQEIGLCEWQEGGAGDVVVNGRYAYLTGHPDILRILDISDPLAPVEVGLGNVPGTLYRMVVIDDYAVLSGTDAAYREGLYIVDVSDPTQPVELAFVAVGFPYDIALFERDGQTYLAILCANGRVQIYRVLLPADPNDAG
jgi:hypothetical protein